MSKVHSNGSGGHHTNGYPNVDSGPPSVHMGPGYAAALLEYYGGPNLLRSQDFFTLSDNHGGGGHGEDHGGRQTLFNRIKNFFSRLFGGGQHGDGHGDDHGGGSGGVHDGTPQDYVIGLIDGGGSHGGGHGSKTKKVGEQMIKFSAIGLALLGGAQALRKVLRI